MRKLWFSMLVLVMLGAALGCDSGGDDGPADAEVFVGNWRLSQLLLNNSDFTAILLASATVTVDFEAATFSLVIMSDSTTTIDGTYAVDEAAMSVTLTSGGLPNPVDLDYTINSENQITLQTSDAALFIGLTGIDPASLGLMIETITLVVQRTAITTF